MSAPAGHRDIRVMTWNVWWRFGEWEARQPALASVLQAEAPDIVGLQEVWVAEDGPNQAAVLADQLGFHFATTELRYFRGVAFTNAILSRWPLLDVESERLPNEHGEPGHRQVLAATVDAPAGHIPFFTTHIDHQFDRSAVRQDQLAAVCRLVDRRRGQPDETFPPVLVGDLNAVPDSDEIRMMTGRRPPAVEGLTFVDAWETKGSGPGHTWSDANPHVADASWPNRRLDYILIGWPRPKPMGAVRSCRLGGLDPVDGVAASDHLAVIADLRVI